MNRLAALLLVAILCGCPPPIGSRSSWQGKLDARNEADAEEDRLRGAKAKAARLAIELDKTGTLDLPPPSLAETLSAGNTGATESVTIGKAPPACSVCAAAGLDPAIFQDNDTSGTWIGPTWDAPPQTTEDR